MSATKQGEPYFRMMALIMLAIVIAGFGALQIFQPQNAQPIEGVLAVHAAVFLGWYVLFVAQTHLISIGNRKLHQSLGLGSVILMLGVVVLGYLVTRGAYARADWSIAGFSPGSSAAFPTIDVLLFVLFYVSGFWNRRNPIAHKRLMLLAGMIMLDPAVARLIPAIGAPPPLIMVVELGLVISLMIYDYRKIGRVHWASWMGLVALIFSTVTKFVISTTNGWLAAAEWLYG